MENTIKSYHDIDKILQMRGDNSSHWWKLQCINLIDSIIFLRDKVEQLEKSKLQESTNLKEGKDFEDAFNADVEKAENMVYEATGYDIRDKYAISAAGVKNGAAKLSTNYKSIVIDTNYCAQEKIDIVPIIIHELLHAVNLEKYPVLNKEDADELKNAIKEMDDTRAKKYAIALFNFLAKDGKNPTTDESLIEDLLTEGDELLSNIEYELGAVGRFPNTKHFVQVYNKLYDKIENSLRYNACGGHTDEWLDDKDAVEAEFDVEIPIKL